MALRKVEPRAEDNIQKLLDDARRAASYVVTDQSIELIASKFRDQAEQEGDIFIPDYQRSLVWSRQKMSYFIESLLLRIPVPPIFLYDVSGRLEVVDGSQRVRCISRFVNNEFRLCELEKLEFLNGIYYKDLPRAAALRFMNTPVRTFVLSETADQSTRVELFRRLNTSGKVLEPAEIRVGAFPGRLMTLVKELASDSRFADVCPARRGQRSAASERQELALRFLAYYECHSSFEHDVAKFLDEYLIEGNRGKSDDEIQRLRAIFLRMVEFVASHFPYGFRRQPSSHQTPRVRFEALSVGTALALDTGQELETDQIRCWIEAEAFRKLTKTGASNSGKRLRERIFFVRDRLLGKE
jgi:hypothetical protein